MIELLKERWEAGSLPRKFSFGPVLPKKSSLELVLPDESSLGLDLHKKSPFGLDFPKQSSLPVLTSYRKLGDLKLGDQVDSAWPPPAPSSRRSSLQHSLSLASLLHSLPSRNKGTLSKRPRRLTVHMISSPIQNRSPSPNSSSSHSSSSSSSPSPSPICIPRTFQVLDLLQGSPIYQNIRVERARLEIDRFQKDFVPPLLEKEKKKKKKEEEEEGIYEVVNVKDKETSCSSSCSSDSGAFSSPSGTFSRLSNPDWGLETGEEEDSPSLLSSSLVHLDREQMTLIYSLSSLSTGVKEDSRSLLSSSLVHLDREQTALFYSLPSLSTGDCSLDKSSPHCNPACNNQVTINGTCLMCTRLTEDE